MNAQRFGVIVFVSGMLLTYGIEYTVDSSIPLPLSVGGEPHRLAVFNIVLAAMLCLFTMLGSYGINWGFERWYGEMIRPSDRVNLQWFISSAFCIMLGIVSVRLASSWFTRGPLPEGFLRLTVVLSCIVSILIGSACILFFYFVQWEHAWRERNDLRSEHLQSQFDALKAQVNPHFLFNNLNTLSGLIMENPAAATEFVRRLADVYRYVLQSMDRRLVELGTELNFLEAYIFILKMRFQQGFIVEMDIPEGSTHLCIAPLTLQILMENAVKHNVISAEHPLRVTLSVEHGISLVVKNNVQKKQMSGSISTHVGLQNIYRMYRILEHRQITIEETASEFLVRIPLIGKAPA